MTRIYRIAPYGFLFAFAGTVLLALAAPAGPQGGAPVADRGYTLKVAEPMSQSEMAGAVGGKPAYCDKALTSCTDGCGNWSWAGQAFVGACNVGCYIGYSQCGGA